MKNKANFFFDNRGFPNWGEGGPHIIPSFSDHFPKTEGFNEYLESLSGISWLPPTASFVPYTLNF